MRFQSGLRKDTTFDELPLSAKCRLITYSQIRNDIHDKMKKGDSCLGTLPAIYDSKLFAAYAWCLLNHSHEFSRLCQKQYR